MFPNIVQKLLLTPEFRKAVSNVPDADVRVIQQMSTEKMTTDDYLRTMLAFNRWANRICDQCWDKSDLSKLRACSECALAFYCSTECKEKASVKHAERCCNRAGPLDDGYI